MDFLYHLLTICIVLFLGFIFFLRLQKKLLRLWKDVTTKEIIFHRLLQETLKMFYAKKELLKTEENRIAFIHMGRSRNKKMRYLLLQERQDLFQHIQDIESELNPQNEEFKPLIKQFRTLQKARRIYNSKVLIYNQTINTFPTKSFAIRMNLKIKEYFG